MLKTKNKKRQIIVAVSGGFDPIHIGHVRLFQRAKKLGNKLVVILNNDNWLKAKKGYSFMPQEERKEVIQAIAVVDEVIITSHPQNPKDMSVCAELALIKPHIFANGGDRNKNNIPEVATCEEINCHMVFNIGDGGKVQSSSWLLDKFNRIEILKKHIKRVFNKKVIIFDLDGTLTKSKANIDKEMSLLLCLLLHKKKVAVIGGGSHDQFINQFISLFRCPDEKLENLLILPLSGGSLYAYKKCKWQQIYHHAFSTKEKAKILAAFKKAFQDINYIAPIKTYGEVIEDRGSQITFSAVGQKAPLAEKQEWNEKYDVRPKLRLALLKYLSDFEVRQGGLTSIDVTKKGIDKAYGIQQVMQRFSVDKKDIVYIGDALFKGGNDYAAKRAGVTTIEVKDAEDTKIFIRHFLALLNNNEKK